MDGLVGDRWSVLLALRPWALGLHGPRGLLRKLDGERALAIAMPQGSDAVYVVCSRLALARLAGSPGSEGSDWPPYLRSLASAFAQEAAEMAAVQDMRQTRFESVGFYAGLIRLDRSAGQLWHLWGLDYSDLESVRDWRRKRGAAVRWWQVTRDDELRPLLLDRWTVERLVQALSDTPDPNLINLRNDLKAWLYETSKRRPGRSEEPAAIPG